MKPEAGDCGCNNQWTCVTDCVHVLGSIIGTGRVQTNKNYLVGCHVHVDTLVSRWIQTETGGCGCDNQQWTCVCIVYTQTEPKEKKI